MDRYGTTKGRGFICMVLQALKEQGPMTADELCRCVGRRVHSGVHNLLPNLHAADLIHISGWHVCEGNNMRLPVFCFGPGDDALSDNGTAYRWATYGAKPWFDSWLTQWAVMNDGPVTARAIADASGRSIKRVNEFVTFARRHRLVRIAGWERINGEIGHWVPVYGLGSDPDVKKPRKIGRKAISRAYEKRKREAMTQVVRLTAAGDAAPLPRRSKLAANSVFGWRGAA